MAARSQKVVLAQLERKVEAKKKKQKIKAEKEAIKKKIIATRKKLSGMK